MLNEPLRPQQAKALIRRILEDAVLPMCDHMHWSG